MDQKLTNVIIWSIPLIDSGQKGRRILGMRLQLGQNFFERLVEFLLVHIVFTSPLASIFANLVDQKA